jgi:hypothetical protein
VSLSRLWLFLAIALPVLAAVLAPMSSVDLTYQLRAGAEILDARTLPTVDTWTFTIAGLPWTDQQWGAQVALTAVYRVLGWTGLVLLRAILTAIVVGATLAITRQRGLDPRLAAVLTLVAFVVAAPAMALRPQLFGMACFAITLWLLFLRRDRPRLLWLIPLVVAIWANLHGSFVLAPVMIGLAWLEDVHDRVSTARQTLLVGAASILTACLTPFGPAVWAYAVGLTSNAGVTARTTEWQPTSLRDPIGVLFFGSVVAVVALIARNGRRVSWPGLLWLAVFAAIGVVAQRGIAWWPFVAVAVVSRELLVGSIRPVHEGSRRLNTILAALVVIAAIALLPSWRPVDPGTNAPAAVLTDAPAGLTRALREVARPGDRVLNPQIWGSWFEFAIPEILVAADSRIEIFPSTVWDELDGVGLGIGDWQDRLRRWDVSIAVAEADDADFIGRLSTLGWRQIHADQDGVILVAPDR